MVQDCTCISKTANALKMQRQLMTIYGHGPAVVCVLLKMSTKTMASPFALVELIKCILMP